MSRIGSGDRGKRRRGNKIRSDVRDAFERIVGVEDCGIIGGGASSSVGKKELKGKGEVLGDESVVIMTSKAIDVAHHPSWTVEHLEKVAKEFLSPATDLMNGSIVFKNLLDCTAIAEPKEL
jgi:hypothetical protein